MTRLLLICADGADYDGFLRRLAGGGLPNLAGLQRRGAAGPLSGGSGNMLADLATLATGVQPEAHGVVGAEEAWAGGLRPISRASWRTPPVWARLAAAGVTTGGIAWPAMRPGAAWPGVHLDEDFIEATGETHDDWVLPRRCAPANLREDLRQRRVHPTDITGAMLKPLVPALAELDQSRDAGLPRLAVAMARAASVQAGAVWLLEQIRPQAVFVRQPWLGEVRRDFEKERDGPFGGVIDGAWRFLDGLVGRLADLAGPDAMVLFTSVASRGRPGVLLAAGGNVSVGVALEPANLPDLAPTVLARFGLEDPGLAPTIEALAPVRPRTSAPAAALPAQPEPDVALLQAAAAAGYAPPEPAPASWRARRLADVGLLMLQRSPRGAGEAARGALALDPAHPAALALAAMAHLALEEPDPLPALADALAEVAPARGWSALARGAYHVIRREPALAAPLLRTAEADTNIETRVHVAAMWLAADRPADAERVFRAIIESDADNAPAQIGLAMTASARRDFITAEARLHDALRCDPGRPGIYLQLAHIYARTARPGQAAQAAASARRLGADEALAAAAREGRLSE